MHLEVVSNVSLSSDVASHDSRDSSVIGCCSFLETPSVVQYSRIPFLRIYIYIYLIVNSYRLNEKSYSGKNVTNFSCVSYLSLDKFE